MTSSPTLCFVIPCYNEGSKGDNCLLKTAPLFLEELMRLISSGKYSKQSGICYIDDGSTDDTWKLIRAFSLENDHVYGLKLSRNRGHQNALLAGLMEMKDYFDVTISMDCDGQDDIAAAEKMVDAFIAGYDVAYGVRSDRRTDTAFKRITAESFYKFMKAMGVETVFNHADYRMLSRRALDGLAQFKETNLFLRGLVPLLGYPSTTVEYKRGNRTAGESHYPLHKMLALALNGITSLSIKPIRIISIVGITFSLVGLIGILWAIATVISGHAVTGWSSIVCIMCLIGGLQLLSLGIIGEYVGRIYLESKHRPRYLIEERAGELNRITTPEDN